MTDFYNSYYNEPYYNQYSDLDYLIAQQQQQQAAAQQQGGIGGSVGQLGGSLAGQYAGRKAGEYALNQIGSSGAEAGAEVGAQSGAEVGGSYLGTAGTVLGALAAAKGGYDVQKGYEQGGKGMRSGLTTMGAGVGSMIMPGIGTVAGAAIGNAAGYGLQGNGWKNDATLLALGPYGWAALAAKKLGAFDHKTTKQVQYNHTKNLLGMEPENKKWQDYVTGMRSQFAAKPPDPSKPFHNGQYASFDEYKKAGLDAADLTGVHGNLETYGPKFADLTFDQQKALTQKNIDSGNYASKKGEVNILDRDKALSYLDEILKAKK